MNKLKQNILYIVFIVIIISLPIWYINRDSGVSRWGPYFLIAMISLPLLFINKEITVNLDKTIKVKNKFQKLLDSSYIIFVSIIISATLHNIYIKYTQEIANQIILIMSVFSSISIYFIYKSSLEHLHKIITSLTVVFFIVSFYEFRNLTQLTELFKINFIVNITFFYVLTFFTIKLFIAETNEVNIKPIIKNLLLIVFPFFLLFLSFRSDQLFQVNGSEYHWSYFVDVIKTVQDGGILLWDTPSQYGFLNILLASFFDNNAWQALYLFQATLLFIVSIAVFGLIYSLYRMKSYGLILAMLGSLLFHFADPNLIGPQPYPSSSVVRFAPSLILLIYLVCVQIFSSNAITNFLGKLVLSFLFIVGSIWSAESFIYCITILLGYLTSNFICDKKNFSLQISLQKALKDLLFYLASLVIVISALIFIYKYRYGVDVSLELFFMYGRYYSAGFGSLPLKIHGALWSILIPIILIIVTLYQRLLSEKYDKYFVILSTIASALFAWLSYYIGRSVPDNIIAMSPMIVLCLLISYPFISLEKFVTNEIKIVFQNVVIISSVIFFLSFITQAKFFTQFADFKSYSSNIYLNKEIADQGLIDLMKSEDNYQKLPFLYYGTGSMPNLSSLEKYTRQSSQKFWLPQPFALLEEPIPNNIREKIIKRYVQNNKRSGYILVDKKHHFQDRLVDWINILENYYYCQLASENADYKTLFCKYK
jgi:hypothetical protein